MQETINKIVANNVRELHSDIFNLKSKVKKTAINLIEIYGQKEDDNLSSIEISTRAKLLITNNGELVGGYLYYDKKENHLEITEYELDDEMISTDNEVGTIAFEELDVDTQISILDEIVKSFIPPQQRN